MSWTAMAASVPRRKKRVEPASRSKETALSTLNEYSVKHRLTGRLAAAAAVGRDTLVAERLTRHEERTDHGIRPQSRPKPQPAHGSDDR